MEKIINQLINEFVKGADIYKTGDGSTWLIFTDNKQWIIELTESKTLWYNYNFFKNIFNYASMDVVENQHYITKWVEDNIINGVNETESWNESIVGELNQNGLIDIVIRDGVKKTKISPTHTEYGDWLDGDERLDEIIKNGVKETNFHRGVRPFTIKKTIENGVKETKVCNYLNPKTGLMFVKWDVEIGNVIETGVKEVQPLPSQEGNKDWGIYYHGKKDRTKPHTDYVDEVIKFGVKN